ncbi:PREDICTED: uncharacterized protein LOC105588418 isoform X1 [Cercocebus atys]|uniref:uncharacterized protein LOC105588418 isoform X1 n=1 Tax=Cercocebus atys TaxID=9531 RepID=UPI0005F564B9|nr:PREDICTED: uncharacterized protein LOC105588418 isoform X1 [Cercocebus atys]
MDERERGRPVFRVLLCTEEWVRGTAVWAGTGKAGDEEKRKPHRWRMFCTQLASYRTFPTPHSADPGTGAGGLHRDSWTGRAENFGPRGGVETPATSRPGSRNTPGGGCKATSGKPGRAAWTSGTPRTAGRTAHPARTGVKGAVPRCAPLRVQGMVRPALLRTAQPRIAGRADSAGRVQAQSWASAPGPTSVYKWSSRLQGSSALSNCLTAFLPYRWELQHPLGSKWTPTAPAPLVDPARAPAPASAKSANAPPARRVSEGPSPGIWGLWLRLGGNSRLALSASFWETGISLPLLAMSFPLHAFCPEFRWGREAFFSWDTTPSCTPYGFRTELCQTKKASSGSGV